MQNIELPFDYEPRPYQEPILRALDSGCKRVVWLAHRRSGKDVTALNYMIKRMWEEVGVYFYVLPSYKQARKVIWDSMTNDGKRFIDYFPSPIVEKRNESEMKVRLHNGSLFQLVGSDNYDALMGTNARGFVFSEAALQDPKAWEFVKPILKANQGWAIFISTPRGKNFFYELWGMAQREPDWFAYKCDIRDTGVLTEEDMEQERREGMSEEMIQQEYYCSFDVGIEGTYYGRLVDEMRRSGRICKVEWQPNVEVDTYWDLGYGDSTSIIFTQRCGAELHVIDYYENNGEGLAHYAKVLQDKKYNYGRHWGPHDVEKGELSTGQTIRNYALDLGIVFNVVPKTTVDYGIECGRAIFANAYIDERKGEHLIKCLENYHKQYNDKMRVYSNTPVHDEWSHGCFVGETKISTPYGEKRIDKIKVGDEVITPNGVKKVASVFEYETNELREITTINTKITCTSNHKIFSDCGLIHADTLRYNTSLYTIGDEACKMIGYLGKENGLGFRDCFSLMKMKKSYISMDIDTSGMEDTTKNLIRKTHHLALYKELFGLTTMVKSLKDIIYTIKMKIQEIMQLTTLSLLVPVNIPNFTIQKKKGKKAERQSLKPWNMPRSGMGAKMEENGIESMQSKPILVTEKTLKRHAINVNQNTLQNIYTKDFVQTNASQNTDTEAESTIEKKNVQYAKRSLPAINMRSNERVLKNVGVSLSRTQKVYDFEVEEDHCYYANGILVSNSDAWRYMGVANRISKGSKKLTPEAVQAMRNKQLGVSTGPFGTFPSVSGSMRGVF